MNFLLSHRRTSLLGAIFCTYIFSTSIKVLAAPLSALPTACDADEAQRPIPKYVQRSYDENPRMQLAGQPPPLLMDFKGARDVKSENGVNEEPSYRVPCPCRYRSTAEKARDDCSHPRIKRSCKVMSIRTTSNVRKYRCCFPSSRLLRLD